MSASSVSRRFEWLPAVLAAVAFAGITVVFARELRSFRDVLIEWAVADLGNRTAIAVSTLREPLLTSDFRAVHEFNRKCVADGIRLSIFGKPKGGLVFDSLGGVRDPQRDARYVYYSLEEVGAYHIRLGMAYERVLKPFYRARYSVALAGLIGVFGVLLFFFVIYRQRVRIRELARLEKFRREFVADVSHEIKTPLTGILGAVELLGERPPEGGGESGGVLLALIQKEAKRLNGLVQSILDLARLEREGDVLNLVEVDLVGLVREQAEKFKVEFRGGDAPTPRFLVRCDPQLVAQAVSNLIGNAVRHSGSREIFVTVERDAKTARIVVEDHGIGIPPEHAKRIFERFHRVDPARAAETGGAGLGLAIVSRIARLHGGKVTLSPAVPHGSRFVFDLGAVLGS